jgi:hypothetical protein
LPAAGAVTSAGQRHDWLASEPVLAAVKIGRNGPARPRTRPGRVRADKACSSKATRAHLRRRKIKATIPEPAGQIASRARRGSRGGRPPAFDRQACKQRNAVERGHRQAAAHARGSHALRQARLRPPGRVDVATIRIWLRDPALSDPRDTT